MITAAVLVGCGDPVAEEDDATNTVRVEALSATAGDGAQRMHLSAKLGEEERPTTGSALDGMRGAQPAVPDVSPHQARIPAGIGGDFAVLYVPQREAVQHGLRLTPPAVPSGSRREPGEAGATRIQLAGGDFAALYPEPTVYVPRDNGLEMGGQAHPPPRVPSEWPAGGGEGRLDEAAIIALICQQSWPCSQAVAVARCESGLRPWVENNGSLGVYQIHYPSHQRRVNSAADLLNAATNIKVAFDIWRDNAGWSPWRPSIGCHGLWN